MMFREKSISKFYAFTLAAVFALTLAGCGGGGGGAAMDDDMDMVMCTAPQVMMNGECVDPPPPMRPMADAKSVMAKAMAIMALEPTTDPVKAFGAGAGPFDAADGATGEERNYVVAVKHADGAASVTVNDLMGATDAPADDNDDMMLMHMGGAPHGDQGDWAGSMFARENMDDDDMVTSTEKVIVYTDIKAPTPTAFAKVTGQALNTNDLDTTKDGDDEDGNLSNDFTALTIETANIGKASSDRFPSTPSTTRSDYKEDDSETEDVNEGAFAGKYNGAAGMFECASSNCSIATDEDGKLETVVGTWHFTPSKGETSPVPDSDYLHYGFWVDSSMDEDGDPVYMVQTFSGGSMAFDAGDLTTLSGYATKAEGAGSAIYNGTAAGVYAQKIAYDAGTGALVSGHVGSFTANVTLTAEFGEQNSVAQTMHNTISGTISDFMDGEIELGWEATLKSKAFGVTGATSGGDGTAAGSWTSSFFGSSATIDHDDDDTTNEVIRMPSGVAGEFVTHFGNGHAAGAYGATR